MITVRFPSGFEIRFATEAQLQEWIRFESTIGQGHFQPGWEVIRERDFDAEFEAHQLWEEMVIG